MNNGEQPEWDKWQGRVKEDEVDLPRKPPHCTELYASFSPRERCEWIFASQKNQRENRHTNVACDDHRRNKHSLCEHNFKANGEQ